VILEVSGTMARNLNSIFYWDVVPSCQVTVVTSHICLLMYNKTWIEERT
jgi:hypothetical protein